MVKANQLDEGPIPAAEVQSVASQYGVNRARFLVEPTSPARARSNTQLSQ